MKRKEKIGEWNKFFRKHLGKGLSWNQIRYALASKGYQAKHIEALIYHYRKDEARRRKAAVIQFAAMLLIIGFTAIMLRKPTITGMPVGGPGDIYYVDATNGVDSNDGLSQDTPIKTIAKANTLPVDPGDSILFKRGETWRCPTDDYLTFTRGTSDNYVTYGAYGTGDKPKFLGSFNASNASMWIDNGGNIWEYDYTFSKEIGNIIFNNEARVGIRNWSLDEISAGGQGYYYYDTTANRLYLYSTANPASYYSSIELAEDDIIIYVYGPGGSWTGTYYDIIENLDLRYSAAIGVEVGYKSHNITIQNLEVSWIGGAIWSGKTRLGNAIQLWNNVSDVRIINNSISEVLDAALTYQGTGSSIVRRNTFSGNKIVNSAYCLELWNSHSSTIIEDFTFDHNTCYDAGNDWATRTNQRYAQNNKPKCLYVGDMQTATGINITNNICYVNQTYLFQAWDNFSGWESDANFNFDYNLYYLKTAKSPEITWQYKTPYYYYFNSLALFSANTSKEIHGEEADPQLVDALSGDFAPQSDSPACTMSSTGSYVGAVPCESGPAPECGDDVCNGDEDCSSCEDDCGVCPPVNNPPTQSTPILNASDNHYNTTDATLACYNQSTADADGDPVTNSYRWFRNSTLVSSLTASTVNAGNTTSGETWKCEVKPYDGTDNGTAMNSSALTINALPDTISVRLNSSAGTNYTNESLTCYANSTGFMTSMTIYYRTYNGSSLYASGSKSVTKNTVSTITNVSSSLLAANQTWKCSVKSSYDGVINESDWNNASLTIRALPTCGDGTCNGNENCSTCEADCGACPPEPFCGDSSCNGVENCSTCEDDCGVCPVDNSLTSCTLENKSWNEDESLANAFNLSSCFNDALDQSLTFTSSGTSNITVTIGTNGLVNLSATANWNGVEHVIFNATAGNRTNLTNNITLTVNSVADCGDSSCEAGENCSTCSSDCGVCTTTSSGGGGGGGGGSVTNESANWNCGAWTACVNGKQTQTCTHITRNVQKTNSRNCQVESKIPTEQKPGKVTSNQTTTETNSKNKQSGLSLEGGLEANEDLEVTNRIQSQYPEEEMFGSKDSLRISALITAGIILMCLSALFFFHGGKKKIKRLMSQKHQPVIHRLKAQKTEEYDSQNSSYSKDLKRVDSKNNIEHLEQLHKYVKEASKIGYTRERVRSELSGVGWDPSIIETVLGMHDSEFLPNTEPEPLMYPQPSDTQIQTEDSINEIQKWIEFENTDLKESEK